MSSGDRRGFLQPANPSIVIDGRDPELTAVFIHRMTERWRSNDQIIVTHVDEPVAHGAAMSIAAACSGRLTVPPDLRDGVRYAAIIPAAQVAPPEPLPHPARPANVPVAMNVAPPSGVANDYRPRTRDARLCPMPRTEVSIVITIDDRPEVLARTLACLSHQTYPHHLLEVVAVGGADSERSSAVLDSYRAHFGAIRQVRREHGAVGMADARNLGIRTAAHENVIVLGCAMAPVPRLVELYVRHLETFPYALYCGNRRDVDANAVAPEAIRRSIAPMLGLPDLEYCLDRSDSDGRFGSTADQRVSIYASTDGLRFEPHPFRVVSGENMAF
ncbi:glycosyltransferase family 2 protein, partial [Ilumatobacter sp.]|uniref:glycosyltransferase family 2 protein n=1 Tax=Ilumatobacter sp. TaxID=1967498 RepID=UPI003C684B3C